MTRTFTTDEIAALIAKLEAAAGPERALDGAIWNAADPEQFQRECGFKGMRYAGHIHTPKEKREHIARMAEYYSPKYTASIDAALTLVPHGNWWSVEKLTDENSPLRHFGPRSGLYKAATHYSYGACIGHVGYSDCPAISLCIAALKARASIREAQK